MHVDPVHARRLILGKTVVHGIHALLWGLEQAHENHPPLEIRSIESRFFKPIAVGQSVLASWTWQDNNLELELSSGADVVLFSKASFCEVSSTNHAVITTLPPTAFCADLDSKALRCRLGEEVCLHLDRNQSLQLFPVLTENIPPAQLAGLLLTSRIIGMRCPGLHSIFTGLKLSIPEENAADSQSAFSLTGFDDRFSFTTISMTTPALSGTLTAFLRPKPAIQPSYDDLLDMVENKEFAHVRGLVIGGSRGLGEVTAKLLAAGGADVRITYFKGSEDSAALVKEITKGGGKCAHHSLDVTAPTSDMAAILDDGWGPTDIFYYASPPIFLGQKKSFFPELYETFSRFYIHGFVSVLNAIGLGEKPLRVLYPSSVAVEELPADMMEYASAKAAGENLCANYSAQFPELEITAPRFPRLNTDQTASLYPVENKAPAPIILDILRQMKPTTKTSQQS